MLLSGSSINLSRPQLMTWISYELVEKHGRGGQQPWLKFILKFQFYLYHFCFCLFVLSLWSHLLSFPNNFIYCHSRCFHTWHNCFVPCPATTVSPDGQLSRHIAICTELHRPPIQYLALSRRVGRIPEPFISLFGHGGLRHSSCHGMVAPAHHLYRVWVHTPCLCSRSSMN